MCARVRVRERCTLKCPDKAASTRAFDASRRFVLTLSLSHDFGALKPHTQAFTFEEVDSQVDSQAPL
jgi:hypothetical protein